MAHSAMDVPNTGRVRMASREEIEQAKSLLGTVCDRVIAVGWCRRIGVDERLYGCPVVALDHLPLYYLVPVVLRRVGMDGQAFLVNGWRIDQWSTAYVMAAEDSDDAEMHGGSLPVTVSDSTEGAVMGLVLEIHRQWIADALDEIAEYEYASLG